MNIWLHILLRQIFLCIVIVAISCKSEHVNSDVKILDGQTDKEGPSFRNTVAIVKKTKDNAFLCSGSLIGDGVILTAAHCINSGDDHYVHFSDSLIKENDPTPERRAAAAKEIDKFGYIIAIDHERILPVLDYSIFPLYKKDRNQDLALVRVYEKSVPKEWQTIATFDAEFDKNFSTLAYSGFGLSGAKQAGERAYRFAKDFEFKTSDDWSMIQVNDSGMCFGDSGGPLYGRRGEKWYVIGVAGSIAKPKKKIESSDISQICAASPYASYLYLKDDAYQRWKNETLAAWK